MTTLQILTATYAAIFGIEVNELGSYYDQKTGDTLIDYASFERNSEDYDIDADWIEAVTTDGNEGCWIDIYVKRYNQAEHRHDRSYVGCIKTLAEGRTAWKDMGALAGEITYLANNEIAWKLYKAARQA